MFIFSIFSAEGIIHIWRHSKNKSIWHFFSRLSEENQ